MIQQAHELRSPGVHLIFDGHGIVVSAAPWLAGAGELTLRGPGGDWSWGEPRVAADPDEIEVERVGGGLRAVVRHAAFDGWTVRLVLTNESEAPVVLDEILLGWRPAPGAVAVVLAGGIEACYALQPAAGAGPVLVGRLRSGVTTGVDERGLLHGSLTLAPGHRWAVQWRWEVVADVGVAPVDGLPASTWLDWDQGVTLPAGPDVAVVAPGVEVEQRDGFAELTAARPGTYGVELRSSRGPTAYDLTWAPDLDDLVDAAAEALLGSSARTTPAGTVRLEDAAAGLVVQDALLRRSLASPELGSDALDLLATQLAPEPLAALLLAREADRTGDARLLDDATRRVLETSAPTPGLGWAAVAIALSGAGTGVLSADVLGHVSALAAADGAGQDTEVVLLLGSVARDEVTTRLARLGASVGAGLPGRLVPEPPSDELAYASLLLGLAPETVGERFRRRWGVSAFEAGRRAAAQVRGGLTAHAGSIDGWTAVERRALAWLVLGRPPR